MLLDEKEIEEIFSLLEIRPIPVMIAKPGELDPLEDGRFYTHENRIVISKKCLRSKTERRKALIHEIRHYYQLICCSTNRGPRKLVKYWMEDFTRLNVGIDYADMLMTTVEIDAFAYTKYIMKTKYNTNVKYPDPFYDLILDKYIKENIDILW